MQESDLRWKVREARVSKVFNVGEHVTIEQVIACGWSFDSYNRASKYVTYLSPDGKQSVVFLDGKDYGVIRNNK